ncbi:hypothetical protein C8R44DRAFT_745337 [Mycena epipterygia]|nr:hypothetical protein C8R44DRAFT_745337 [Mycena epipterygia]
MQVLTCKLVEKSFALTGKNNLNCRMTSELELELNSEPGCAVHDTSFLRDPMLCIIRDPGIQIKKHIQTRQFRRGESNPSIRFTILATTKVDISELFGRKLAMKNMGSPPIQTQGVEPRALTSQFTWLPSTWSEGVLYTTSEFPSYLCTITSTISPSIQTRESNPGRSLYINTSFNYEQRACSVHHFQVLFLLLYQHK